MSEEQLKAFLEKVKADTSLQEKLKAERVDVVAIAKAAGFSITPDDINLLRENISEKELEAILGGAGSANPQGGDPWCTWDYPICINNK
ncbi:lantipeptide precursor/ Nif11-like leader peptide domain protein [Synechococcus sp. BIOS-E4-1]|uniref:Nif11-like leader peptide family natural product precursor n=1 Tax=Synechococcus sp. BIOS-E4-1 TaxID=1400864 RepID=UPI0016463154|nr:Nif11-like leader peptide family natural product precursor [Synechococcus sp. BIOS-E4-1]QNI54294.1 lantipeptide precursor/ Nif11-like leader peptide domain protein [Synechococcus sp. BIOS-E4-1]